MSKEKVLTSFQELHEEMNQVPMVDLPAIDLGSASAEEMESRAKKIRKRAADIEEWVTVTLFKLDRIQKAPREIREEMTKEISQAEESLESFLSHEMPAYRRTAWLAYLTHLFSRDFKNRLEVIGFLDKLTEQGRLIEESEGPIHINGRYFAVPEMACFGEEEINKVKEAAVNFSHRATRQDHHQRKEKTQELQNKTNIALAQILEGKPGTYALGIPPERSERNGEEFWRGGGTMLIEGDGDGRIFPLDASGTIENAVKEAVDMGIFVLTNSLTRPYPPFIRSIPEKNAKKTQLIWYLLRRGIKAEESKEADRALLEKLSEKAMASQEKFFLERKPGIYLIDLKGVWRSENNPPIHNLFFLIERTDEDFPTIKIKETPKHLQDFFAGCQDEYIEEGEKFEGLPNPLKQVLKAIFGQVAKASQIAKDNEDTD